MHIHTHTHTQTNKHARTHTYTHAYTHTYTHTHTHTHTYTHAQTENADLIDTRLAILAEGKSDSDDCLNEQAFIEECQLIIAKGAFPASAGSQVCRPVYWLVYCIYTGKCIYT